MAATHAQRREQLRRITDPKFLARALPTMIPPRLSIGRRALGSGGRILGFNGGTRCSTTTAQAHYSNRNK